MTNALSPPHTHTNHHHHPEIALCFVSCLHWAWVACMRLPKQTTKNTQHTRECTFGAHNLTGGSGRATTVPRTRSNSAFRSDWQIRFFVVVKYNEGQKTRVNNLATWDFVIIWNVLDRNILFIIF